MVVSPPDFLALIWLCSARIAVGIVDADVVGQVVAVVLQAAQLFHPFVVRADGQPLKEQVPAFLVGAAEVGVEERRAQDRPAVHHHVVDAAQIGRGAGEELVALAAEAQLAQGGVQVVELGCARPRSVRAAGG